MLIWIFCAISMFALLAVTPQLPSSEKLSVAKGTTNCAQSGRGLAPEHAPAADTMVGRTKVSRALQASVLKTMANFELKEGLQGGLYPGTCWRDLSLGHRYISPSRCFLQIFCSRRIPCTFALSSGSSTQNSVGLNIDVRV